MEAHGFPMTAKQVASLWGRMVKTYTAICRKEEHTGGGDGDAVCLSSRCLTDDLCKGQDETGVYAAMDEV